MPGSPVVKEAAETPFPFGTAFSTTHSATKSMLAIFSIAIFDVLAVGISLLTAYVARAFVLPGLLPGVYKQELLNSTLQSMWWLPLVVVACMAYEGLYQKRMPYWREVGKALKACTLAVVFSTFLLYLSKSSAEVSRTLVVITWAGIVVFIPIARYYGKLFLVKVNIWNKPVLVMGAGKTGILVARALAREKTMGYRIIGFLDDNRKKTGAAGPAHEGIPVLGSFDDAEKIIAATRVEEMIIAAPGLPARQLVQLTNQLQPLVNNVMLVPDLFGLSMNGIEVEHFFDEQTLLLSVKNRLKSNLNKGIKRAFDMAAGLVLLFLSIPLLLVIAVAIKLDSRGPVFFAQERLGQAGGTFTCYKFRTMFNDADALLKEYLQSNKQARDEWRVFNKLREYDPRVTRVGSVLRRFSLDELPQLINVIVGDMSLVGPRPYLPREKKQMGDWAHDILVTKPGITGLWQVSGRNEIDFEGRLKLDTWYVRNWSLWLDIVLLLKTIRVVLKQEGAF